MNGFPSILLVEDNPADAYLIKQLFSQHCPDCHITVAGDGDKALDCLTGRGEEEKAPFPDLIFLDLNLPKTSGREFLKTMRTVENLRKIPVLVFSSSISPNDISECYALGANAFIAKPVDLDALDFALKNIFLFWVKTAILNENMAKKRT